MNRPLGLNNLCLKSVALILLDTVLQINMKFACISIISHFKTNPAVFYSENSV